MLIPKSLSRDGRLYLEDLAVGQRFVTATYELNAEEIMEFARKYDPQPFHLNEAAAKESLFEGLAASGWHTAAISMRLFVEGGPKFAGGLIGVSGELTWPRPTRPGDTLHVVTEILEVTPSKSRPDCGMVTVRNTTLNQNGETVQSVVAKLVVPRRM